MATVTINVDDQDLARVTERAQAEGTTVEEWLQLVVKQESKLDLPLVRPRDPVVGMLADEPELADAIDQVVAERQHMPMRTP